jgi:hypothetical protein
MQKILITILAIMMLSCEFEDTVAAYEDKLVIFCNLPANLPLGTIGDTCFISLSSSIEDEVEPEDLYISNAVVTITQASTNEVFPVSPVLNRIGRYLTADSIIFQPGETYTLHAVYGEFEVSAETTIPSGMDYFSPDNQTQKCEGVEQVVPAVNTENFDLQWLNYMDNPDTIIQLIDFYTISTAVYRKGSCYTESFASFPLFMLDFEADNYATIKVTTVALEAYQRGLEPFEDLNSDGEYNEDSETFTDFNRNGIHDSTFVNLIYDTSLVYKLWKENYLRDEHGDPYRVNPFTWQVSLPPVPMSWLFFNYYGLTLVILEATDDAYYNYYSGDPAGQNQYLLPESNIIGGYGLFSSTNAKAFLVNIERE